MTQWAENNNKIDQAQSCFRNGFSTIDNLKKTKIIVFRNGGFLSDNE